MPCTIGKNGVLKLDGSAIAQLTAYTITENADTVECSHFDTGGWREYKTTMKMFDGSADIVWARQDGDIVVGNVYALELFPEGDDTITDWKITGDIIITSFDLTASTEENVSGSISFQGTGPMVRTVE